MTIYTPEEKETQKLVVARVLSMNPSMSVLALQRQLRTATEPINLSREYLTDIVREVRLERIQRLRDETKEDLYGQVAELVEYINGQLRAIAQEEKLVYTRAKPNGEPGEKAETRIFAQNNRIKALNSIIDNTMKLVQLKMDLGLVERNLGTFAVDVGGLMGHLRKIRNGDYSTPITDLVAVDA